MILGLLAMLSCLLFTSVSATALYDPAETTDEISIMVQEHIDKAKIPSVSIGIVRNNEVTYLSFGEQYDSNALYQIGSTTKAFTALGILWLEDEGVLSLDDPVNAYLPWFCMKYNGQEIPGSDITIANLLYQTSGFTNDESKYPKAKPGMTLEAYIRTLAGCELSFYPSAQYAYANANYATLGLLIEVVTGKSYQDFMSTTIIKPLSLQNTYVDPELAAIEGNVVPGSRLSFFQAHPYDVPVSTASIPSGYIFSNAHDISRWLQIQLGAIEVSPQMRRIIEKSHQPDENHFVNANTRYAAGWFVQDDGTIYHTGGTPNYSTKFLLRPDTGTAVCVLANSNAAVNVNTIADNVLNILTGTSLKPYQADIWVVVDTIFTILTFISVPLIFISFLILLSVKRQYKQGMRVKERTKIRTIRFLSIPAFLLLLSAAMIIVFPLTFNISWFAMWVWAPYSLYTGVFAFTLLSISLAVVAYVASGCPKLRSN